MMETEKTGKNETKTEKITTETE